MNLQYPRSENKTHQHRVKIQRRLIILLPVIMGGLAFLLLFTSFQPIVAQSSEEYAQINSISPNHFAELPNQIAGEASQTKASPQMSDGPQYTWADELGLQESSQRLAENSSAAYAATSTEYEDLSQWSHKGAGSNNWTVYNNGTAVKQIGNTQPSTFFISPDSYRSVVMTGKFKVENDPTDDDNDFIGLVLGYQDPLDSSNSYSFVLFDWKKEVQSHCGYTGQEGFGLMKVDSTYDSSLGTCDSIGKWYWKYFWGHQELSSEFELLDSQFGSGGWEEEKEHEFEVMYQSNRIKISIDGSVIFDESGSFPAGRVGFYSFSQSHATYYDVVISGAPLEENMIWGHDDNACFDSGLMSTRGSAGKPIDTFNGNLNFKSTDLSIPVQGCQLQFTRSYISAATDVYTTTLGHGWTHNYDMRLHLSGTALSDTVELQIPNGSRLPFYDNEDGTFTPYAGVTAELTQISNTYVITSSNQKIYTFDSLGLLLEQQDANGNVITFTHNVTNQLTRVAQGSRYLDYTYNLDGRVSTVTDNLGRDVELGYNNDGNLVVVTNTLELETNYYYSATQPVTPTHYLTEVVDPSGVTIEKTAYDAEGRAYQQWDGEDNLLVDIDFSLENTRVVTENGIVMTHTYNARNTLIGTEYSCTDGTTGCGTGGGNRYDGNFRQDQVVDANDNAVDLVWSANGSNLEQVTDELDQETTLSYDAYNNLTQVVNALDKTTSYQYDNEDFPTFLTSMTDALDNTTIYTPTTTSDGVPGLLKQQRDPNGRLTTYTYNDFGQVMQVVQAAGTSDAITATYGYDAVGRLITTTQQSAAESHTSLNVYNDGDQLIATINNWTGSNPANWETDCDTSSGSRDTNVCTQYDYDNAGRIISTTNTLGQTTLSFYDDAGRSFLSVTNWDGSSYGQSDPVGDLCNFTSPNSEFNLCAVTGYDVYGRVVTSTNSLGYETVTEYDSLGRIDRTIVNWENGVYSSADPDADIIAEYEYDAVGNVIVTTDTLGLETRTFYDVLNRVEGSISNWDGSATLASCATLPPERDENICTQYEYDAVGNTIIVTNTLTQTTRTFYDDLNRVQASVSNWNPATLDEPGDCVISATNSNSENICTLYGYDDA
ncbi:MAG: hypothetical protein DWQ04_29135, partial [Chloroflexi bacterium]